MNARRIVLVAAVILGGGSLGAEAHVRSYEKLSLDERLALQESDRRIAIYDQQMVVLDWRWGHHDVSRYDYGWMNAELLNRLREESVYQNAIIVQSSNLPNRTRDVFETIVHGALVVPVGIGYLLAADPQLLQFLTLIH